MKHANKVESDKVKNEVEARFNEIVLQVERLKKALEGRKDNNFNTNSVEIMKMGFEDLQLHTTKIIEEYNGLGL